MGLTIALSAQITINEIFYDPTTVDEKTEFLELYNPGPASLDISNWYFDQGIDYSFPISTTIDSGEYIVVAKDPTALAATYSLPAGAKVFGPFTGSLSNEGESIRLRQADDMVYFCIKYYVGGLWPVTGLFEWSEWSIQLLHESLDPNAAGSWSTEDPSPGEYNVDLWISNPEELILWESFTQNPKIPAPGTEVDISFKLAQSQLGMAVNLEYQEVLPGQYISKSDAAYLSQWTAIPMTKNGSKTYEVKLPASLQLHRSLIRYRFQILEPDGDTTWVPTIDNTQPNFAYFIYDTIPDFGSYPLNQLQQVPVYHLIAKETDVNAYILAGSSSDYLSTGTLVYEGCVYDHIGFRAQGRAQRHERPKRNIKINMNKAFPLITHDEFGMALNPKDKLVLHGGTLAGPEGALDGRHDGGLSEGVALRQFDLFGANGQPADWMQLRIIDGPDENPALPNDGDFWGIFNIVSEYDGAFLLDEGLADGPLHAYKPSELKNVPSDGPYVFNHPDYLNFSTNVLNASQVWYETYMDLDAQFRFMACNEAISQQESAYFGKHYQFDYQNPLTGGWRLLPSDLDDTMLEVNDPSEAILRNSITQHSDLMIAYQGYIREFRDLLFNNEQFDQLIDEKAGLVHSPGASQSLAHADRDRWALNYSTFDVEIADLKSWFQGRQTYIDLNWINDSNIPNQPLISYIGLGGYPADQLTFLSSTFSDPQGAGTFGAMEWRLAEFTDAGNPYYQADDPKIYEAQEIWTSGPLTTFSNSITLPPGYVKIGRSYRVRVRMQDNTGRWSHWSAPHSFIAGSPQDDPGGLVINEIHYHPKPFHGQEETELEFIELKNINLDTLHLFGWKLEGGIQYTFSEGLKLAPDSFLVLANHTEEFSLYYGFLPDGEYSGNLKNAGESMHIIGPYGTLVDTVHYYDSGAWDKDADGNGPSLELINPFFDNNVGKNWVAALDSVGTPGKENSIYCKFPPPPVVINELNYNYTSNYEGLVAADWIELYNHHSDTVNLSAWKLMDEDSFYVLPDGLKMPPNSFLVAFDSVSSFFKVHPGFGSAIGPMNFSLKNSGEKILLLDSNSCAVDHVRFIDKSPWPVEADGSGATAHLADPGLDNNEGLNWYASGNVSGTPGAANDTLCQQNPPSILLNEVNYNSFAGFDPGDWVELYNPNAFAVDISGWEFHDQDGYYTIPAATTMNAGAYLVLAKDLAQFNTVFPFLPNVVGGWTFSLNGDGERLALLTDQRCWVWKFEYNDSAPWPTEPDGNGPTLALIDPAFNPDLGGSWASSTTGGAPLGTPGGPNNIPNPCAVSPPEIVINEIVYNSPPGFDTGNWIELYNPNSDTVNVSNWEFHSESDGYIIPFGTLIPAGGYLVLVENDSAFSSLYPSVSHYVGGMGFGLSNSGERIALYTSDRCLVDSLRYNDKAPWPTYSDGMGPSLSLMDPVLDNALGENWTTFPGAGTPGQDNSMDPCNGVPQDGYSVVINELNYHSADTVDCGDWVELYNPTADTIDISFWKFSDSTSHWVIPAGTKLAPEGYLVLVEDSTRFSMIHPAVSNFIGNLNFNLSNSGEYVVLYNRAYCIIDSFNYQDIFPWPLEADGKGSTAALISPFVDNSQGEKWDGSDHRGTPGQPNEFYCAPAQIRDGLGLWLSAASGPETNGLTSEITAWKDQSRALRNPTIIGNPTWDTLNVWNQHPVVNFDGSGDYLTWSNFSVGDTAGSLFILWKHDPIGGNFGMYRFGAGNFGYGTNNAAGGNHRNSFGRGGNTLINFHGDFRTVHLHGVEQNGNWVERRNGSLEASTIAAVNFGSATNHRLGRGNAYYLDGQVAEVVYFHQVLDTDYRNKLESYFSIKYGISIPVTSHKYYTYSGFPNNLAGLGKDVLSCLDQQNSMSIETGAIVRIFNASDLKQDEYLVWGHDGNPATEDGSNTSSAFTKRLSRVWRISETGEVGTTSISFDLSGLGIPVVDPNDFALLIDKNDGDFSDVGNYITGLQINGNVVSFTNVDWEEGDWFTLATERVPCPPVPPFTEFFKTTCDPLEAGSDTVVTTNFNGCDSLLITITTLLPIDTTYLYYNTCNPQDAGIVDSVFVNQYGCDSLVVSTTILRLDTTNLIAYTCDPDQVGISNDIYPNQYSCDSLVITETFLAWDTTYLTQPVCAYIDTGWTSVLLTNQYGCDSLVYTYSWIAADTTFILLESCDPADIGTVMDIYTNQYTCDSLVYTITDFPLGSSPIRPGDVACDLGLWLMGDSGLNLQGLEVALWEDQSGMGNHASIPYVGQRAQISAKTINGHITLQFDGVDDWYKINGVVPIMEDSNTMFAVFIPEFDTDHGYWFSSHKNGGSRLKNGVRSSGELIYDDDDPPLSPEIYWDKPAMVSHVQKPTIIDGYINGFPVVPRTSFTSKGADRASLGQEFDGSGQDNETSNHWKGYFAELIIFDTILSDASRHRVETYLNIKYGFTIPVSSHGYYAHTLYPEGIAGLGKDQSQALNQANSKSLSDSTILQVKYPTELNEGEYLVWGHNGESALYSQKSLDVPPNYSDRLARAWCIAETGEVGDVDLDFDLSGLGWPVQDQRAWVLLVDDDGDFSNGVIQSIKATNLSGDLLSFDGINLDQGHIFSLAREKHVLIQSSLWLQGPYDFLSGLMRDDLRSQDLLPTTDPYLATQTVDSSELQISGPSAIVDWIQLQIVDPVDSTTVLYDRAYLLQRNGRIRDVNGDTSLYVSGLSSGNYFLVARHRNHLSVMSANALTLNHIATDWDLRANFQPLYGAHAQKFLAAGAYGLWAGDANGDGQISFQGISNDPAVSFLKVLIHPGNTTFARNYVIAGVYDPADANMDGNVIFQGGNSDTSPIFLNVLAHPANITFSRNFVSEAQLP